MRTISRHLRRRPSPATVISIVALFVAIGGTAYALPGTNTVNSGDIINGQVKNQDLHGDAVASGKIENGQVRQVDLRDTAVDSAKVEDESLTGSDVVDFGLSNQDVGVEFAQVNAEGTLANSSGGVTATRIGLGTYVVDYGHDIQSCAYVTTQGEAGVGGAGGAITGNTDRSSNNEATFTTTRTNANALADRAFQQIVVC
jgi:hypothetical protein